MLWPFRRDYEHARLYSLNACRSVFEHHVAFGRELPCHVQRNMSRLNA